MQKHCQGLPWPGTERMAADDAMVAEFFAGLANPGEIRADGDRAEFLPQFEIASVLIRCSVSQPVIGSLRPGVMQVALGRGDGFFPAPIAIGVDPQVDPLAFPSGQVAVDRSDTRAIHRWHNPGRIWHWLDTNPCRPGNYSGNTPSSHAPGKAGGRAGRCSMQSACVRGKSLECLVEFLGVSPRSFYRLFAEN